MLINRILIKMKRLYFTFRRVFFRSGSALSQRTQHKKKRILKRLSQYPGITRPCRAGLPVRETPNRKTSFVSRGTISNTKNNMRKMINRVFLAFMNYPYLFMEIIIAVNVLRIVRGCLVYMFLVVLPDPRTYRICQIFICLMMSDKLLSFFGI